MEQQIMKRCSTNPKPYVVLVGMDFSEPADHALRKAIELCRKHDRSELHVACILPPGTHKDRLPVPGSHWLVDAGAVIDGVLVSLLARVRAEIEPLTTQAKRSPPAATRFVPHVLVEVPAHALVQLARECSADVIVIGARGQGRAEQSLGSVAKDTLSHAPCTVVLTHLDAKASDPH